MKKLPTFTVTGRIILIINKEVAASSLEAALEEAGKLTVEDFTGDLEIEYEDASLRLTGAYGDNHYDTEQ